MSDGQIGVIENVNLPEGGRSCNNTRAYTRPHNCAPNTDSACGCMWLQDGRVI